MLALTKGQVPPRDQVLKNSKALNDRHGLKPAKDYGTVAGIYVEVCACGRERKTAPKLNAVQHQHNSVCNTAQWRFMTSQELVGSLKMCETLHVPQTARRGEECFYFDCVNIKS